MPLTAIRCLCSKADSSGVSPLSHIEVCEERPFERADQILEGIFGDTDHVFGKVTATRILDCPRKILIQDCLDYAADLGGYEAATDGTMMHSELAGRIIMDGSTLVEFKVKGLIGGQEVSAIIDQLRAGVITDWKTTRWNYGTPKPKDEHIVQVNIQRLLAEQAKLGPIKGMRLTYHFWGKGWATFEVPEMSEEDILDFKPFSGPKTVREILATEMNAIFDINVGGNPKDVIKGMPLDGRGMKMGKGSMCEFCPVAAECGEMEGIVRL